MTPLRVYVAGASAERHERVRPVMARLRAAGIEITHDWTEAMHEAWSVEDGDAMVPESMRDWYARQDRDGVMSADVVVLLAPDGPSTGAWVELGLAIGREVPIVVSGRNARRTIFTSLANRLFDTDEEAIRYVVEKHRR